MNIKHLGDALDHWKGSVLSLLSSKDLIRNVVVEPMITDDGPWPKEDIETYRRLLRLESGKAICHAQETFSEKKVREEYFRETREVSQTGDLFLDPDTGIATGNPTGNRKKQYIKIREIEKLLSHRILMVYHHSAHESCLGQLNRLRAIGNTISDNIRDVHYAIWPCGQVAAFFISLSKDRIDQIESAINEYLPVIRGTGKATAREVVHKQMFCPSCQKMVFKKWPLGWDAHAAFNCPGAHGDSPERRKADFRQRFAHLFLS